MTPQTDKATAYSNGCRITELYLDGKEYSISTIIKSVNEYKSLCKVADKLKAIMDELSDGNGISQASRQSALIVLQQLSTLRNGK